MLYAIRIKLINFLLLNQDGSGTLIEKFCISKTSKCVFTAQFGKKCLIFVFLVLSVILQFVGKTQSSGAFY